MSENTPDTARPDRALKHIEIDNLVIPGKAILKDAHFKFDVAAGTVTLTISAEDHIDMEYEQ